MGRNYFVIAARAGALLALIVVVVGAWVRLTDAGLGCPDWPGCYGQILVPDQDQAGEIGAQFERPLEAGKAWREMIHRYLASTLGLICLAVGGLAWLNRRDPEQPRILPAVLVALVMFQGMLGMLTVTLLLKPVIVMGHLLGGLSTLGVLFWLSRGAARPLLAGPRVRVLGIAALAALVMQIALGGWTSSNYAAMACPDFPTCQTQWWPKMMDFDEGFILWRGIGIDYEGGVLDNPARVAIHFTHRLGAILATLLLTTLGAVLLSRNDSAVAGLAILGALFVQLLLGASIVLFGVPLAVAAAHNGVAALLLLSVLNVNQRIWRRAGSAADPLA
jgi:cytochrome c oxidase assembly protein subunit 15